MRSTVTSSNHRRLADGSGWVVAWLGVMWAGLRIGATVLLDPAWPNATSFAAAAALRLRLRPTVLFSVPSLYRQLLLDGHAAPGDGALRPSPGVQVQPLDGQAAAAGLPTRLLVRSATVALGDLDRPAAETESFRAGAFCPEDLFVREFDGSWRFTGREDSRVKLRWRWVDLVQIEEQLAAGLPAGARP